MPVNLNELALSRTIWRYRNSPKFKAWISILPLISEELLQLPFEQITRLINLDDAEGEQLDICGRIAGVSQRPRVPADNIEYFGYAGTPGTVNYNIAPYVDALAENISVPAPDYLFKLIIRAKIFKNNTLTEIDDLKRAVDFLLDEDSVIIDGQDMTVQTVWLQGDLRPRLRAIIEDLGLIPRPQGVKITRVEQAIPGFGYAGQFNVTGYNDAPYKEY